MNYAKFENLTVEQQTECRAHWMYKDSAKLTLDAIAPVLPDGMTAYIAVSLYDSGHIDNVFCFIDTEHGTLSVHRHHHQNSTYYFNVLDEKLLPWTGYQDGREYCDAWIKFTEKYPDPGNMFKPTKAKTEKLISRAIAQYYALKAISEERQGRIDEFRQWMRDIAAKHGLSFSWQDSGNLSTYMHSKHFELEANIRKSDGGISTKILKSYKSETSETDLFAAILNAGL